MDCVISGANGFVGRALVKRLYKKNSLKAIIRKSAVAQFSQEFPLVKVFCLEDLKTDSDIASVIDKSEVFFHIAGMKGIKKTNQLVKESLDINVLLTMRILEVSLLVNIGSIVFLSSEKAEGKHGVYGSSKFLMEKLLNQYNSTNPHCQYKALRCGNIAYSPDSVLNIWKNKLLKGEDVIISRKDATRFFCSVDQCVDYILECHSSESLNLFIPNTKSVTLGDLLNEMIEKYDPSRKSRIVEVGLFEDEYMLEALSQNYNSNTSPKMSKIEIQSII